MATISTCRYNTIAHPVIEITIRYSKRAARDIPSLAVQLGSMASVHCTSHDNLQHILQPVHILHEGELMPIHPNTSLSVQVEFLFDSSQSPLQLVLLLSNVPNCLRQFFLKIHVPCEGLSTLPFSSSSILSSCCNCKHIALYLLRLFPSFSMVLLPHFSFQ